MGRCCKASAGLYRLWKSILTNTFEELQKHQDDQSINQLVMELAKYGRFCGNKVSEICYQNYALAFGISNMESNSDDLDEILRVAYKQSLP